MTVNFTARGSVPRALRAAFGLASAIFSSSLPVHAAIVTPQWKTYQWSRIGDLAIPTVNNLSTVWQPHFNAAIADWSHAPMIDLIPIKGISGASTSACRPSFGTIQLCSGEYGNNGWLGYANVYTQGGFIVQATVRLNDSLFKIAKYNNDAFRTQTICHELGHTLGLDHNNANRYDRNTGGCMDYSNQPAGGGSFGPSNINVGPMDFAGLNIIYKELNGSQLPSTMPPISQAGAVPEPTSWAMLVIGFGVVGAMQRRSHRKSMQLMTD